jgi:hypothetical protein
VSALTLILADLHPLQERRADATVLPRLPSLELALARARMERVPGGWRQWLAREVCEAEVAAVAPAGIAAAGWLEHPADLHYWFATPVHFFAGIDSLHLHPAGLLSLTGAKQQCLVDDFARVFEGSGFRLYATGRRELLLSGPSASGVQSSDPARWLGGDPTAGLPQGAGADPLRRLGAEIEMWLHAHALNRERAAAGELTVSALWLWGGAGAPRRRLGPLPLLPRVYAEDAFAEGLCRCCGGVARALPPRWEAALLQADAGAEPDADAKGNGGAAIETIVVLPTASVDALARLRIIDAQWVAPALADLHRGRLRRLRLIAGERHFVLQRWGLWRVWRGRRPWWEVLA